MSHSGTIRLDICCLELHGIESEAPQGVIVHPPPQRLSHSSHSSAYTINQLLENPVGGCRRVLRGKTMMHGGLTSLDRVSRSLHDLFFHNFKPFQGHIPVLPVAAYIPSYTLFVIFIIKNHLYSAFSEKATRRCSRADY